MQKIGILKISLGTLLLLVGCNNPWNDPYRSTDKKANIYYSSFTEQPKTLDPARAYNANEAVFTAQTYEPPLQYHYLKRPYTLIPQTVVSLPKAVYLDKQGNVLSDNTADNLIAFSRYDIAITPGIYFQPHPAFAKDKTGNYYYHKLQEKDLSHVNTLADFPHTGTRELTAADYVYEIKRFAHPQVQSPILGVMSQHIVGLNEYAVVLQQAYNKLTHGKPGTDVYLNLNSYDFPGAQVLDRYRYRITIKGKYPQLLYWLAMPFFAPIPWEADYFYSQPGMDDRNLTLDWFPVGTGAYMLTENNPNRRMVLTRNPNYHGEKYPTEGEPVDQTNGLLQDAGKPLPFVDKFIFTLEKESIPRWSKFLQGYYDQSGIGADIFDQAVKIDAQGNAEVSKELQQRGLRLYTAVGPSVFYLGFNMLDDVVGGNTEQARKLRIAISIAMNYEEFISIFLNGRAFVAQSPIPPGIFGYREDKAGIDPYVYDWVNGKPLRKSIDVAKKILAEAGYPQGRSATTGAPLILNLDVPGGGGPDDAARFAWIRKEFANLGIQLQIRDTQYNRFQEKMRNGDTQIYFWGWTADYPDPENFFFLLYGPNSKVKAGGENTSNYHNSQFDELFQVMRAMPNSPQRQAVIDNMQKILWQDTPWIWGFYPKSFTLAQQWVSNIKVNELANNSLKYYRIDPLTRAKLRQQWNQPKLWPLGILALLFMVLLAPVIINYWRREHKPKPLV
ncbi:ABC transporter substrate-binding protein [soil metagenome]